jgi:hypothetical protein
MSAKAGKRAEKCGDFYYAFPGKEVVPTLHPGALVAAGLTT